MDARSLRREDVGGSGRFELGMRILVHFGGSMLESRGTPSRVRNLALALSRQVGFEILAVSRDSTAEVRSVLGMDHESIPAPEETRSTLARAVGSFRPDLVYGHTHKALGPLSALGSRAAAKRVVDLHGDLAAEKLEQHWRPAYHRIMGFIRERLRERRFLAAMDGYTTVGRPLAERTIKIGKPTEILWGGVDPELFCAVPTTRKPGPNLRVFYAGNFRPYQGISRLLDAAERLVGQGEPFHFSLIGDYGPFQETAQRARRALGDNVTLLGQLPYEQVPEHLAQADILVIPRPDTRTCRFGFPSKLPEYLAMGKPVVATRVGDLTRVITNRKNGILIPPGSVDHLVEAMLELRSETSRAALGAAGRKLAEEELTWEKVGGRAAEFFRKIMRAGRTA